MVEEFEGFDDIFSTAEQAVSQKRLEANVLSNEELKEIYEKFREHHMIEIQKDWKERTLYVDKYGATWVAVKTPPEYYEYEGKQIKNEVKQKANGEYFMFGYNAILLGQYTTFMYFGTEKKGSLLGYSMKGVVRGKMTTKYYLISEDYKKARWDNQLVRDYNSINNTEHKTLSEVPREAYKINLTFNYWQTVMAKDA